MYLARPDLSLLDLVETAKTIIRYQIRNPGNLPANKTQEIEQLGSRISEAYRDFRQEQQVSRP